MRGAAGSAPRALAVLILDSSEEIESMTTRSIVAAVLMLSTSPVLASDVSVDQRSQVAPSQPCTCACARRQEAKEPEGRSQPQVDYGETATSPSY